MAGSTQHVVTTGRWEDTGDHAARRTPPANSRPAARHDGDKQRLLGLAQTIETEVIPRLVLARRAFLDHEARAPDQATPSVEDVLELASLVRAHDETIAASYVDALRAQGVPVDILYLDLLAPTARHLGELWDQDQCDFMEVTLGLWRLQRVLYGLSPAFHSSGRICGPAALRALLVPVCGEQHTFGLYMVAEFFRRAGWEVSCGPSASPDELVTTVRNEWIALVGISVGSERHLESVAATIRAIRRRSRNQAIGVMVGGPVFLEQPELAVRIGADATAIDGRQATLQAQNLLTLLTRDR